MKKFMKMSIIILIFLTGVLSAQSTKSATVKFVIGSAQKLPANQTSWSDISLNAEVFKGDRIKTGLNSRVEIEMPDGSKLKIDQNSIFDIKEIKTEEDDGEDQMSFSIWAGNLWANFKKVISGRQTREIESPSAVVAIRGTTLEVDVDQNLTTRVTVTEGQVAVKSKDVEGEVLVGASQETIVKKGEAPTNPVRSNLPEDSDASLKLRMVNIPAMQKDPAVLSGGLQISGTATAGAKVTAAGVPVNVLPNGQFSGRVQVTEGYNNIQVVAEKDGQSTSQEVKVFVNTRRPQITLSTPLVAGFLNKRNYSLSGAVFDETPLDKIIVYLNGEEVADVRGRGSFNRTIVLQEGKNDIRINAVDLAENSIEKSERIFLDTVSPIITITEPAQKNLNRLEPPAPPGQITARELEKFLQIVRGVIIDPEPSSKLKRVTVNGKEVKPNSDGSFQTEFTVGRGETRILIEAEDVAGNITRDNSRRILIR